MKRISAVVVCVAILDLCISQAVRAERISYYRIGAAAIGAGALQEPGQYDPGFGFNLGVSVPFKHRLAATLDLTHDRLAWVGGSEPTIGTTWLERDDLSISTALLGVELVPLRGWSARPIASAACGAARIRPGDAELGDLNGARWSIAGEAETVFALDLGAGLRVRLPPSHTALRVQVHWLGLFREEFAHVVPARLQLEF